MSNGIIIKALSGFYYVKDRKSLETYECRARGKFRKDDFSPLVGDYVDFSVTENGKGIVDKIMPRKNSLVRPPVANIDKLFVVAAAAEPAPNHFVIDKMIMNAENNKIEPIIVVNKCDISPEFENIANIYRKCGFCVICVSAATGEGIDALKNEIGGSVCAFSGNTGVGKSSIINALEPTLTLSTGEISDKLGRGRHTTRHIQLYSAAGGYIADTPGFSSFDMDKCGFVRKDNVQFCFREFQPYITKCKFTSCSHTKEKGCAIIDAVNCGDIPKSRFESYCRFYEESAAVPDWQLK